MVSIGYVVAFSKNNQFGSHVRSTSFSFQGDERNANFDHTVVNDDLEVAYEKLKGILIKVS